MKKLLFSLIIVAVVAMPLKYSLAKTPQNQVDAIVKILRTLNVEESKITDIVKILQRDEPAPKPTVKIKVNPVKSKLKTFLLPTQA